MNEENLNHGSDDTCPLGAVYAKSHILQEQRTKLPREADLNAGSNVSTISSKIPSKTRKAVY